MNGDQSFDFDRCLSPQSPYWNATIHVKYNPKPAETMVHNHASDKVNPVGQLGWAGVVYLSPDARAETGLYLWENRHGENFEWMTPAQRWEMVDRIGNRFNRIVLCRGQIPHSGGAGFGNSLETGRMFQTFFFRTRQPRQLEPLALNALGSA